MFHLLFDSTNIKIAQSHIHHDCGDNLLKSNIIHHLDFSVLSFWGNLDFLGPLHFLGCLHFQGCLHFWGFFIIGVFFIFGVKFGIAQLSLPLLVIIATLGPNLQFQLELNSCLSSACKLGHEVAGLLGCNPPHSLRNPPTAQPTT